MSKSIKELVQALVGSFIKQKYIAPVETGNSASRAYAKDDLILWKNVLYKATRAITSGTSFVVGTNLAAATIRADLHDNTKINTNWSNVYDLTIGVRGSTNHGDPEVGDNSGVFGESVAATGEYSFGQGASSAVTAVTQTLELNANTEVGDIFVFSDSIDDKYGGCICYIPYLDQLGYVTIQSDPDTPSYRRNAVRLFDGASKAMSDGDPYQFMFYGHIANAGARCSNIFGEDCATGGEFSHAEGHGTHTLEEACHAEGQYTIAKGKGSHAEGYAENEGGKIIATGIGSHAEGYTTATSNSNSKIQAVGNGAHAEGFLNINAYGSGAHAEGYGVGNIMTNNNGAHAEGCTTSNKSITANGFGSHAEGYALFGNITARGAGSHAEGNATTAYGDYSHAGGTSATALLDSSFVQGGGLANKFTGSAMAENGDSMFGISPKPVNYTADTTVTDGYNGCSGTVSGTATVTVNLAVQGLYLIATSVFTISTGVCAGVMLKLIGASGISTGTPLPPYNIYAETNGTASPTVTPAANNIIKIKNTAATTISQFHLIRIL